MQLRPTPVSLHPGGDIVILQEFALGNCNYRALHRLFFFSGGVQDGNSPFTGLLFFESFYEDLIMQQFVLYGFSM
jgi:hypothetical protein